MDALCGSVWGMKNITPLEGVTLSRKELTRRWRCCIETIKRREKSRVLKALKLGRLVRYRLADVEAVEAEAEVTR